MNRRFIIAAIVIIISFLLIDNLFGTMMDRFTAHSRGGDTRNLHYIYNELNDSIIVFGSSRANHHYDTSILNEKSGISVYNCGIDGNGVLLACSMLQNIIDNGHKPRLIIYDFFPEFDIIQSNDHERVVDLISRYYRNPGMKEIIEELSPGSYYKFHLATIRYNSKFIQTISDALSPRQKIINGFKPLNGAITTNFNPDRKPYGDVDTLKVKYWKRFLKLCDDNDIELLFAISPDYHRLDNPEDASELFTAYIGERYRLIDFRNHEEFTGHKELFSDPAHLNHYGAEKYTTILWDSIISRGACGARWRQ